MSGKQTINWLEILEQTNDVKTFIAFWESKEILLNRFPKESLSDKVFDKFNAIALQSLGFLYLEGAAEKAASLKDELSALFKKPSPTLKPADIITKPCSSVKRIAGSGKSSHVRPRGVECFEPESSDSNEKGTNNAVSGDNISGKVTESVPISSKRLTSHSKSEGGQSREDSASKGNNSELIASHSNISGENYESTSPEATAFKAGNNPKCDSSPNGGANEQTPTVITGSMSVGKEAEQLSSSLHDEIVPLCAALNWTSDDQMAYYGTLSNQHQGVLATSQTIMQDACLDLLKLKFDFNRTFATACKSIKSSTRNLNHSAKIKGSFRHKQGFPHHPMDIVTIVFMMADNSLKIRLMKSFVGCALAFPLFTYNSSGHLYFNSWGLRAISIPVPIKSKIQGLKAEKPLTNVDMLPITFLRQGSTISKSAFINMLLNGNTYSTFYHRSCPNGRTKRKISNGIVESVASFQLGDLKFPSCVLLNNLRGDAFDNMTQVYAMAAVTRFFICFVEYNLLKAFVSTFSKMFENIFEITVLIVIVSHEGELRSVEKDFNITVHSLVKESPSLKLHICNVGDPDIATPSVGDCVSDVLNLITRKVKGLKLSTIDFDHIVLKISKLGIKGESSELCSAMSEVKGTLGRLPTQLSNSFKKQYLPLQCSKISDLKGSSDIVKKNALSSRLMRIFTLTNQDANVYIDLCLTCLDIVLQAHKQQMTFEIITCQDNALSKCMDQPIDEATSALRQNIALNEQAIVELRHVLLELGLVCELTQPEEPSKSLFQLGALVLLLGYPLDILHIQPLGDAFLPHAWVKGVLWSLLKILGSNTKVMVLSLLCPSETKAGLLFRSMFGVEFPDKENDSRGLCARLVPVTDKAFCHILLLYSEDIKKDKAGHLEKLSRDIIKICSSVSDCVIFGVNGESLTEVEIMFSIAIQSVIEMKKRGVLGNYIQTGFSVIHQNVSSVEAHAKLRLGRNKFGEYLNDRSKYVSREMDVYGVSGSNSLLKFDTETDIHYLPDPFIVSGTQHRVNKEFHVAALALKNALLNECENKHVLGHITNLERLSDTILQTFKNDDFAQPRGPSTFHSESNCIWFNFDMLVDRYSMNSSQSKDIKEIQLLKDDAVAMVDKNQIKTFENRCHRRKTNAITISEQYKTLCHRLTNTRLIAILGILNNSPQHIEILNLREAFLKHFLLPANLKLLDTIVQVFSDRCPHDFEATLIGCNQRNDNISAKMTLRDFSMMHYIHKDINISPNIAHGQVGRMCKTIHALVGRHIDDACMNRTPLLIPLVNRIYNSITAALIYLNLRFASFFRCTDTFLARIYLLVADEVSSELNQKLMTTDSGNNVRAEVTSHIIYNFIQFSRGKTLLHMINDTPTTKCEMICDINEFLFHEKDVEIFEQYLVDPERMALTWLHDNIIVPVLQKTDDHLFSKMFNSTKAQRVIYDKLSDYMRRLKCPEAYRESLIRYLTNQLKPDYCQKYFECACEQQYESLAMAKLQQIWGCPEKCPVCFEPCILKDGHREPHQPLIHRPLYLQSAAVLAGIDDITLTCLYSGEGAAHQTISQYISDIQAKLTRDNWCQTGDHRSYYWAFIVQKYIKDLYNESVNPSPNDHVNEAHALGEIQKLRGRYARLAGTSV